MVGEIEEPTPDLDAEVRVFRERYAAIVKEIGVVIAGHDEAVRGVVDALVAGGNCLLEGVPGLGKTLLVRTLASVLDLPFGRIQFTPDLMPADITGTNIVEDDERGGRHFRFQEGPVFTSILLADEINRATPKTQSALLEAMQERSVTSAGTTRMLPDPFMVIATQNPIEMEGTYPLPEAQLDRFLYKLIVSPSDVDELTEVLSRTTGAQTPAVRVLYGASELQAMRRLARAVPCPKNVLAFAARLSLATNPGHALASPSAKRFVRYGASPRGAQALVAGAKVRALAAGRLHAGMADIIAVAPLALRHRIILNFEGETEGIAPDAVVADAVKTTPQVEPKLARAGV